MRPPYDLNQGAKPGPPSFFDPYVYSEDDEVERYYRLLPSESLLRTHGRRKKRRLVVFVVTILVGYILGSLIVLNYIILRP